MENIDYNNTTHTCIVCGSEEGKPLEDLENSDDFELIDECGRTIEVDGPIVICEGCLEESHDAHWHVTHLEY